MQDYNNQNYNISPPRMCGIDPTSKMTGIPAFTLRKWYAEGKIVGVKSGRRILLNVDRLIDFLNTHTEQEEPAAVGGIRPIKVR